MTKVFIIMFSTLTFGAASLTYYDVGLDNTKVTTTEKSVRSGSYGGGMYYGGGGGGYRRGK